MDFKVYRQKAREYQKNKCIINKNIENFKEDGIFIEHWGEASGTLKIIKSMTTKEMQEIEKEFNVHFSLGGDKITKFEFNKEIDGGYNPLMKEIRVAQKNTFDLYNGYFEEVLKSVYQRTEICNKTFNITLGTKFWGFRINPLLDRVMTTDELMAIEKETDSEFKDYNVTTGYRFDFKREEVKCLMKE